MPWTSSFGGNKFRVCFTDIWFTALLVDGVLIKFKGDLIISSPDVSLVELGPDAEFVLVATDGLWDYIKSTEAVAFVRDQLCQHGDVQRACEALGEKALEDKLAGVARSKAKRVVGAKSSSCDCRGCISRNLDFIASHFAIGLVKVGGVHFHIFGSSCKYVFSFLGNDSNVHENMMLPKLDTFVLLTNEGPSLDKKDEPWNKFKRGDDGMRKGIQGSKTELQMMISGL
ncbi:putative protein phosphatase 2C 5 [Triticum urartu]|uniref:protein-serine/threonine phosphatase n=1 Tax=Triticum urartu TaxID=4572 RepID=M7YEU9_TRIUA|nr:putative protein phosphatase 2C 5 [Triticum urartu]